MRKAFNDFWAFIDPDTMLSFLLYVIFLLHVEGNMFNIP